MALIDASVAAFSAIALVVTITPGADTMLVVRSTLARGAKGGILSTAGILSGGMVQGAFAAFGLSTVLLRSAELYSAVKFLGALYLIYLGIKSLIAASRNEDEESRPSLKSKRSAFLEGFVTNALNPKVALFYAAFLPQFIAPTDPLIAKTALLIGIHYSMGLVWLTGVTLAVGHAAKSFRVSRIKRVLEGIAGVIFVGLGAKLAIEHQ